MQSRILDSSFVVDFMGFDFDSANICTKIKLETDKKFNLITDKKLDDWEVHFIFRYNNVKQILIYTKGKSHPREKYKEITVHIPIPIKTEVSWGVDLTQHIYQSKDHLDNLIGNFICLHVDYSKFLNRTDYILSCMRRAIQSCLEKGFPVDGVKVKIT